jgi:DNA-binding MarR family transcriptional regulator
MLVSVSLAMNATNPQEIAVPEEKLTEINALESTKIKLIYLSILTMEEATATELQQLLGLSKLTLLPILTSLVQKDLVDHTEDGYAPR